MKKRKDGLYQTQITIEVNGEKKQKYFYGKTEAEVRRKLAAFNGECEKGPFFLDVAEDWKEEHFSSVAHKTTECYSAPFKRILEQFKGRRIRDITPQQVNLFIHNVAKSGYSLRTVRAHIAVLNMIFKYSILNGYTMNNPAEYISPPSGLKTTKRELPDEKQIELIKESWGKPFGLFAFFILYSGCRRGELMALSYEDIDFDNKVIHITKSVYINNNKPYFKSTKTDSGTRDIILLDTLADKLDRNKTGLIFDMDGHPLTLSAFQKRWKKYQRESGVTVSPHQIRHAYATILYEAGIDELIAKDLLGHASISTTRNIYTHIRQNQKKAAAEMLNKFIK